MIDKLILKITQVLLFGMLIIYSSPSIGQEKFQLAYEKEGDKEMKRGNYQLAIEHYKKAKKFFTIPARLYYKTAQAFLMEKNYDKAEYYYEKLISEFENINLNKSFPYFYLNLAKACIQNNNALYAREILHKLLESNPNIEIYKEAKRELERIDWIIENNLLKEHIFIDNLGKNINNHSSQSGSFVINDSVIFFTNLIYKENKDKEGNIYYSDIYNKVHYSYIDSLYHSPSKIFEPRNINKNGENVSNICFDTISKTAYFTICDKLSDNAICKIYYSNYKNNKWSRAKKLNNKINLRNYNTTHPYFISKDNENILYFSSNRPQGYGGYDIWYINTDSIDMDPINLGASINTKGDEITPYFSLENNNLYFSSNYHFGFGGYDIFQSKGWKQRWGEPVNLMLPINSPANEMHPFIIKPGEIGYITSNREGSFSSDNKTCCYDIYKFYKQEIEETPIIDQIKNSNPFIPALDLPLNLYFHNDQPNPKSISNTSSLDYRECYKEYMALNNLYKAQYSKGLRDSLEITAIDSIEYFFKNNLKNSMNKLDHMLEFLYNKLEKGERINISIRGFSSSLHNDLYNFSLSERRINTLSNYMRIWNKGKLNKYMDSLAQDLVPYLNIKTLGLGKIESNSPNPSSLEERRKSIYRLDAMQERKIEIRLIEFRNNK